MGVTRPGRFPGVALLGDAWNPEFMGKTGNYSRRPISCWVSSRSDLVPVVCARRAQKEARSEELWRANNSRAHLFR